MKYRKDVTDQEVHNEYQRVFKAEIEGFLVPRVRPADTDGKQESEPDRGEQKGPDHDAAKTDQTPNDAELQLLESIFERPNLPITKRTASLGLSPYSMNKLKGSVISKGFAEQFTINLGKDFGGNITLLALTDRGHEAIGRKYNSMKLPNESLEHMWWKEMIRRHYTKKNIPAEIEKSIGGKHADIGIRHKGRDIAIEVELSTRNALTNIMQDLKAGFDLVLSCAKSRTVQAQILSDFRSLSRYEQLKDKVTFRLLSEFEFVKEMSGKR